MTPKYWTGIAVCMLAIFAVGMLVARGIDKAHMFISNNFPASLGLINSNFRVDGRELGDIQRLQFMRSTPGLVDSAVLTVKLKSDADSQQDPDCRLRVINAQPFGSQTRFNCTSVGDSARLKLVRFGHVELMPEGKIVTLYVSGDRAPDVQHHAYRGTGSTDSGDVDIRTTDGTLSITVNGREIVHASGDSSGGAVVIRDENGKPILELSGGDNGASIKVTDANGKPRLNIHTSGSKKDSAGGH